MDESLYLTEMPQSFAKHGLCKTLLVRREVIHIKHILTEVFVRKTIRIEDMLLRIRLSLFDYIEYMTNRMRSIHHFPRSYTHEINEIVKEGGDRFFPSFELYNGLRRVFVLDFDGVVTKNKFKELYDLCLRRGDVIICSANPLVDDTWFTRRGYALPSKIYACRGAEKKIIQLLEIQKRYDIVFYVDDESKYLDYAWLFGIHTYIYKKNKIIYHTLNSK